jgi:hypothetical protein
MINLDYDDLPQEPMPLLYVSQTELDLVKRHIILPYVVKTLEHDIKVIRDIKLKAANAYIKELDSRMIDVFKEIDLVRKELREQNIKVYEVKLNTKMGYWEYILRGNRHEMGFMWNIVRAEVEIYLMDKFNLKY